MYYNVYYNIVYYMILYSNTMYYRISSRPPAASTGSGSRARPWSRASRRTPFYYYYTRSPSHDSRLQDSRQGLGCSEIHLFIGSGVIFSRGWVRKDGNLLTETGCTTTATTTTTTTTTHTNNTNNTNDNNNNDNTHTVSNTINNTIDDTKHTTTTTTTTTTSNNHIITIIVIMIIIIMIIMILMIIVIRTSLPRTPP